MVIVKPKNWHCLAELLLEAGITAARKSELPGGMSEWAHKRLAVIQSKGREHGASLRQLQQK